MPDQPAQNPYSPALNSTAAEAVTRHQWTSAHVAVLVGVCVVSVSLRLIDSPLSNFASMAALALFTGSIIRHPAAFLLPVAIRAITDLLIHAKTGYGFFPSWPFDYSAYALIYLFAAYNVRPAKYLSVFLGGIAAVGTYFLLSNFGVWFMSDMYPRTAAGLVECFTMAIPFARGTVLGNLIAVPVFFTIWNLFATPAASTTTANADFVATKQDA